MAAPTSPSSLRGVATLYLRHVSSQMILGSAVLVLAARLYLNAWGAADLWVVLGTVLAWPFFEWLFHVLIHLPPLRIAGRVFEPKPVEKHRMHHANPPVVDFILLPPSAIVFLACASMGGFWLVLDPPRALTAALCFHFAGLLNGWVHLLTHTRYVPRSNYFKWVRKTHYLHHFKDDHHWFSFVGPYVDVVFGTHRLKEEETS